MEGQRLESLNMHKSFYAHPTAVLDKGCKIGKGTKIWHFCHIMPEAEVGENCILGQNVFIAGKVYLGNRVKVQNNVSVYEGVICEDETFLGPSMVFTNLINPRSAFERKDEFKKTLVKKGTSIGANATIICGNRLGSYSFIAAGAVVTEDVKAYALMAGVPAKQIGWMSKAGHQLYFNNETVATCPETGQKYKFENEQVYKL